MSSSVMILVLVLVAGVLGATVWPPSRLQPATARTANGRERPRRVDALTAEFFTASVDDDDDTNIVMDTLRVLGIVRRRVDRPVVGRRAYVRWWERLRALIVLGAIVVALGVALAAVVGITVLSLGFLLERAIS